MELYESHVSEETFIFYLGKYKNFRFLKSFISMITRMLACKNMIKNERDVATLFFIN